MRQRFFGGKRIGIAAMLVLIALAAPMPASADDNTSNSSAVCTNFSDRMNQEFNNTDSGNSGCTDGGGGNAMSNNSTGGCSTGLLSEIYIYIKTILNNATQNLFNSFIQSDSYKAAVTAAVTLSVIFFGVAFTIGVMQISFGQVLVRLLKIGIIFTLVSPSGWDFFNSTAVQFFSNGTDELVTGVVQIATGITPPAGSTPFYAFDKLADFIIQPDTVIAIMGAMVAGGPFGMLMGSMMVISTLGFISLLVKALRLYAVSFVARSLLLGLAPVFIVFLLFERTKNLFISWLNALITMSLQPILMFTFLSFFIILIQTAATDMFGAELCWNEFKNIEGTQNKGAFWRFVDPKTHAPIAGDMTWKGSIDCLLQNGNNGQCPEFPINIVDILSFLILVYLAGRFADSIERTASELSNAYLLLDTGGRLDQFFQSQGSGGGGLGGLLGGGKGVNPSAARSTANNKGGGST